MNVIIPIQKINLVPVMKEVKRNLKRSRTLKSEWKYTRLIFWPHGNAMEKNGGIRSDEDKLGY